MDSAKEFFEKLFNPECELSHQELAYGVKGVDLRECSAAKSHVEIRDDVRVYRLDDYFRQNKVINPDRVQGLGCRHDFIIVSTLSESVEVFFVEMKSAKDGFNHVRHQLQGGLSMFAMMQRFCVDRLNVPGLCDAVRYYAVALLHTESLAGVTDMRKLHDVEKARQNDRDNYAQKKGIFCVVDCQASLKELRDHAEVVTLDWDNANTFPDFPT